MFGLRKWIGLWLCRRGYHKVKLYVGVDYASRGTMAMEIEVCQRCKQITIVGVKNDTEQIRKMIIDIHNKQSPKLRKGAWRDCRACLQILTGKPMEGYMIKHRGGYWADWCNDCPYLERGILKPEEYHPTDKPLGQIDEASEV